jgi:hypothetical protein
MHRVLQRDWNTRQWALEVNLGLQPGLGLGNQQLGDAVGALLGALGNLAVGAEDIDGVDCGVVDVLDEILDGLVKDVCLVGLGDVKVVRGGEVGEAVLSLLLFLGPGAE